MYNTRHTQNTNIYMGEEERVIWYKVGIMKVLSSFTTHGGVVLFLFLARNNTGFSRARARAFAYICRDSRPKGTNEFISPNTHCVCTLHIASHIGSATKSKSARSFILVNGSITSNARCIIICRCIDNTKAGAAPVCSLFYFFIYRAANAHIVCMWIRVSIGV